MAASPPTAVGREAAGTSAIRALAAADAAAERGWFVTARDHWRSAARDAEARGDSTTTRLVAAKSQELDALERALEQSTAVRERQAAAAWTATDWPVSWRVAAGPATCGVAAGPPPLSIANGLVVWNTGRSVHAVALADGRPRWPAADERDTCIFPRGVGGPASACTLPPTAAASAGGKAYAVIDQGRDGHLLVCLDLSDSAEGRLAWSATAADAARLAPRGATAFDGPPVVDHELCCVVIRADDARGGLALAVFDSRDGGLRWVRGLGTAVAADGSDRARGRRQPCLAEDRIVVDTHTGAVHAFDRDGTVAWTTAGDAAAAGDATCVSPPHLVRDRLLLAAGDGTGIVAVDPRGGTRIWEWRAEDEPVTGVLGAISGGLVLTTRAGGRAGATLRRLAVEDGRQTAAFAAAGVMPGRSAGAALAAGTIFLPVAVDDAADGSARTHGLQIEVLDAVTLERRRRPVDAAALVDAADAADDASHGPRLAVADGRLVIAAGAICCIRPAPPSAPDPTPR
jgi:outer membrane protein assembly factor BamB